MTAACPCCHDLAWNHASTYFTCGREHSIADFAGLLLAACPHCHDDAPVEPFAPTFTSQLDADEHVAGQWFAMRAVGVHFDTDGVHKGERRQQAALARLAENAHTCAHFPEQVAA